MAEYRQHDQIIVDKSVKPKGKPEYTAAVNLQPVIRQYVRSKNMAAQHGETPSLPYPFQAVYLDRWCEEPMSYVGKTDQAAAGSALTSAGGHEFKCSANPEKCIHYPTCHKSREIPLDAGIFGQIPAQVSGVAGSGNLPLIQA